MRKKTFWGVCSLLGLLGAFISTGAQEIELVLIVAVPSLVLSIVSAIKTRQIED